MASISCAKWPSPAPGVRMFSRWSFDRRLHPPVGWWPQLGRPLAAGIPCTGPSVETQGACTEWALCRRPHSLAWEPELLGLRDVSMDVCRCRKTSLFSLLFGKFGELPKSAPLRERRHVSREAAEHRGLGLPSPGAALTPLTAAPAGKQPPACTAACRQQRGIGLCISVGLADPMCCTGVRRSESLSKSCPLCSMSEVTAVLSCMKDLTLEPSELLAICIH